GNIIGSGGGNILGNNGASWKLLAAKPALPFVGAEVRLVDAAGQPVPGPDGKPLVAITDGTGAYSFTANLPARNLLIDVTLPEGKGTERAVVPRDGGKQVVDVDLVSTLTTGYIVEQYVKTQKDPLATLEKLPAAVEADTRAKAAAAIAAADFAPTDLLTPAVVKAVEDLRKADKTLDAQMEAVKRLLVVAGASELGTGLKATEVTIRDVDDMVFAADGTLFILTTQDNRVWHLKADGTLEIAAGDRRPPDLLDLAGKLPTEANLNHPDRIALDPQGRLVIADARGVYRVGDDGKLQRLTALKAQELAAGKDGDLVVIVKEDAVLDPAVIEANGPPIGIPKALVAYRIRPGAAPDKLFSQLEDPEDDGVPTVAIKDLAWDGGATCFASVTGSSGGRSELWKIDLATKAKTVEIPSAANNGLTFDGRNLIYVDAALAFHGKPLYGTGPVVDFPKPPQWSANLAVGPDGKPYASKFGAVYRLDPAGPVRIAGTEGNGAGGNASVFTFEVLGDSAVDPAGNVYALDTGKGGIYKVDTNRQIVKFAEPGGGNVQLLSCDPAGKLYMSDGDGAKIGKFDDKGIWTALYSVAPLISGFTMASDGTGYATNWDIKDRKLRIFRLANGTATQIDEGDTRQLIGLDAAGTLWTAGGGKLRKWDGSAFKDVKADARFTFKRLLGSGGGLAIDAKGRLYFADPDQPTIFRFDPATGKFDDIAGPGTSHFAGGGTDDGLNQPRTPSLDAAGNLYFSDTGNRQVKRIAANEL
ncbi:MAG: repeat containing protein, partial [Cyanobacteria bacterium RYN_339]|nr:repeat containing protein [Cyanobacteria bacterium RYN_339]